MSNKKSLWVGLSLLTSWLAFGAEFAPYFTAGAVLQRDRPIEIWGTGRNGEQVVVELMGHSASTAVAEGAWRVSLPAMAAASATTLKLRGDNEKILEDIALGEVWFGCGQSNMEWRLNQCAPYSDNLLAQADQPSIRQLKIPLRPYKGDPQPSFAWKKFDRSSGPVFGALAYYFAAALQREIGVTVGIVNCSFGGSTIEAWMTREELLSAGMEAALAEDAKNLSIWKDFPTYDKAWKAYQEDKKAWDLLKKKDPADPTPAPSEPYGYRSKRRPTTLRDAMLKPVLPYGARGAVWYQGENNAGQPADYAKMLPVFMEGLRRSKHESNWPILIAQLSSPSANWPDEQEGYAPLREIQRAVAVADSHSGFIVALDYGEKGQVHPRNKQPVGERLARLALGKVYKKSLGAVQSPYVLSAKWIEGNIEVSFAGLVGALEIRKDIAAVIRLRTSEGKGVAPKSVHLSSDQRRLIITPEDGLRPDEVRYAYQNFCELGLYSEGDLPVSPWILSVKE